MPLFLISSYPDPSQDGGLMVLEGTTAAKALEKADADGEIEATDYEEIHTWKIDKTSHKVLKPNFKTTFVEVKS